MSKKIVGLIGMGLMGQAFIKNLTQSQIHVQGYDTDKTRMDQLRKSGGTPLDSPHKVGENVDIVITSLPNSNISREVFFGKNGLADKKYKDLIICDTTTSRPEDSELIASELKEYGIHFIDTAVSGTSAMAEEGDLVIIAGGEKNIFNKSLETLNSFSRASYYMGPSGSGARTKLIINLILAGNRLALAEGLVLGEKAGLDLQSLLNVVKDGASGSKTMIDKGPKMIEGDFTTQSLITNVLKDSRLMLEQGQKYGAPMLMTQIWSQLMQASKESGYGDKDVTSFIEILRKLAGLGSRID
tara:strand:- start:84729 stop:85625 length:897 start_codon:yes stop_codon:yes gene_type:complete